MYMHNHGLLTLGKAAEAAADFFFPWGTYCVACGSLIDRRRSYCLCDHCMEQIRWGNVRVPAEAPLDSISACMQYGLTARQLIFALKYNGKTYMARILAAMLRDRLLGDLQAATLLQADDIVPVPLHREKLKTRGFNQTERIGTHLSSYLGIPLLRDALRRVRSTSAQRGVAGSERYLNLLDAFAPGPNLADRVNGRKIILLDDIYTTGATAVHCGRVLKESGAARVDVLVLATGNEKAEGFFLPNGKKTDKIAAEIRVCG